MADLVPEWPHVLAKEQRLSEVRKHVPSFSQKHIDDLYHQWKHKQLIVKRDWGNEAEPPQELRYHPNACILPSDRIQLLENTPPESLKISTWNVNSIRTRMELLLSWLEGEQLDIVALQETKVEDSQFPRWELEIAGYQVAYYGQKSYNGVAILSKHPIEDVRYGFSNGYDAEHKRLIAAKIEGIWIVNVYIPQGQNTDSPKFPYKLEFLNQLQQELTQHYSPQEPVILLGDFNVAPDARDVVSAEAMAGKVSFHPQEHQALSQIQQWGFTDCYRQFHEEDEQYTWWDFRTRGFERNEGMRIDHIWASAPLQERCQSCEIDRDNRSQNQPSDHAPVTLVMVNA